jgi:2-oxoglutarate ferredoxin oxidoreductase subunit alpha
MFMMDEVVGHMVERVEIPPADRIQVVPRKLTRKPKGEYKPYATTPEDLVPEMTRAGDGHRIHVTGLTHDERGYPAMNPVAQDKLVRRLIRKIRDHAADLVDIKEDYMDDAEVVVVSYGITSRIAKSAVDEARARGIKAGHLRLRIVWPFPAERIRGLCQQAKVFVMPELNMGQVVLELERVVAGKAKVLSLPHAGGSVHEPEAILKAILEAQS